MEVEALHYCSLHSVLTLNDGRMTFIVIIFFSVFSLAEFFVGLTVGFLGWHVALAIIGKTLT